MTEVYKSYKPDPTQDGINHLNVYSRGKTQLGRFLSNFTYAPIETIDGHFDSVEGYWYWLGTDAIRKDELRKLSGFAAKSLGRTLRAEAVAWQDETEFRDRICAAIDVKLATYPEYHCLLRDNALPLAHYYVMGGKAILVPDCRWILDHLCQVAQKEIDCDRIF